MFGLGRGSYFSGEQAIEANIKTKILEWVGECFFDQLSGIDWKNLLGPGQQQNLEIAIKSLVLQAYGIVAMQSIAFNFNAETRAYVLTMTITTIYSPSAIISIPLPTTGG